MKKALIFGISGQDGSYLSKLLIEKGYEVWGISRDTQNCKKNLELMEISESISLLELNHSTINELKKILEISSPDEIYYLSGPSSVSLSIDDPHQTISYSINGVLNLLEAVRLYKQDCKMFFAGSGECFQDMGDKLISEKTPFNPSNPYGVAKSSQFLIIKNYREMYNINACVGILFNHESPLRGSGFVTTKIFQTIARIASGSKEKLELGSIDVIRDWGWAPEYVEAMWLMLQNNHIDDYIIASGESHSLENFVNKAFKFYDLSWKEHTVQRNQFMRDYEIKTVRTDPSKIKNFLGWKATSKIDKIVKNLSIYFQITD